MKQIAPPCPAGRAPATDPDRLWAILRDLRTARIAYGLKPPALQTLQALISFVRPGGPLVVFASNRALSERSGGVHERTLRRHLADLEARGLIQQRRSSNGKRFRSRSPVSGEEDIWGIDLSPLPRQADDIRRAADDADREVRECRFLRARLLGILASIGDQLSNTIITIRKLMRRKLDSSTYRAMIERAENLAAPPELSADDGHSVRHHSMSEPDESDSERADLHLRETSAGHEQAPEISLTELLERCPEAVSFAERPPRSWLETCRLAWLLGPMIGIGHRSLQEATERLGNEISSAIVLLIVQSGDRIRKPGAYFHAVTAGKRASGFRIGALADYASRRLPAGNMPVAL